MSSPQNGAPRWLAAVRRLERAIGVPVERFVTSDAYFDLLPHLRRTQEQVEDLLARYGIGVVVDIRSQPYSRFKPQFGPAQTTAEVVSMISRHSHSATSVID